MTPLLLVLSSTAAVLCLIALSLAVFTARRRTSSALMAWGSALGCLNNVLANERMLAAIHAGFTAWAIWPWWHSGGGDSTKRRLRRWVSRFRGVRRTAPVTA